MSAPRTPSPDTLEAVHHYEDRLLEFAMACAVYGRHDPETALWNARRALEAACLIVCCLQQDEAIDNVRGSKHPPKSLDKLLHEIWDLRDPHRTSFDGLQRLTNLGVHVRLQGRTELASEVNVVQEYVISALGWLYDKSIARKHLAQAERRATVEEGLRGSEGHLSPHLQLAEIERLLREVVAERDAQRARVERAEIRADEAERERDKLLAERAKVVSATRKLRWARWRSRVAGVAILGGSVVAAASVWCIVGPALNLPSGAGSSTGASSRTGGPGSASTATMAPTDHGGSSGTAAVSSATSAGLGGVSGGGAGADEGGGSGANLGEAPGAGAPVHGSRVGAGALVGGGSGPAAGPTSATASDLARTSSLPATSLSTPPAGAAVPPTCPAGMALVPATTIRIGQPTGRATWPAPSPVAIAPIDVPAFCIDRHPTRWSDLPEPLAVARQACSGLQTDRARCLTRDEAERACEARGLRLPRLDEWEAVLRAPTEISTSSSPKEWVQDRYPPKVLNRFGPAPQGDGLYRMNDLRDRGAGPEDVWWSWNQQPPDPRFVKVGFRCATDAVR